MTVQRAPGNAGDLLLIDDHVTVLNHGHPPAHQRDVETLPCAWLARLFGRGHDKSVDASGMMAGRFLDRVVLDLHLVPSTQINPAVGSGPAIEFHVKLEIVKFP